MRTTTPSTATSSKGQSFSDNVKGWQDNPFEGPTRNNYAFAGGNQTPDYLGQLEANDVRNLNQNDGTFAGSITPPEPWARDPSLPAVIINHAKWTFDEKLAYDLRVPSSAPGEWGSDFTRGFSGEYRNVMEGPAPSGERVGSAVGSVVEFGKGMIGMHSASTAKQEWNNGNYGASAVHGMAAVGQAGLTLLTVGSLTAARQVGINALSETVAGDEISAINLMEGNAIIGGGRMSELNAKWGYLNATERRALLENKSEATWSDWLAERDAQAKSVNPNTHFLEKHGPDTTLADQQIRATQGIAPDGSMDKAFRDSTRFMSARDMGAAMQRADSIFQLNGGINKAYSFQMESFIGEGFTKAPNSNWMLTTNVNAVYRNGQPYTMFPLLRSIK